MCLYQFNICKGYFNPSALHCILIVLCHHKHAAIIYIYTPSVNFPRTNHLPFPCNKWRKVGPRSLRLFIYICLNEQPCERSIVHTCNLGRRLSLHTLYTLYDDGNFQLGYVIMGHKSWPSQTRDSTTYIYVYDALVNPELNNPE